jgi:hypothetical protein
VTLGRAANSWDNADLAIRLLDVVRAGGLVYAEEGYMGRMG